LVAELQSLHLNGHERDEAVEQADHVQEPARDGLGDNDGGVIVLGVALPLDIPVLDGPDEVGLVGPAELDLDLVAAVRFGILAKQVQPAGVGLHALLILEDDVAQTEQGGIFRDTLLNPPLVKLGVVSESNQLRLDVLQACHRHLAVSSRRTSFSAP
jgi:hypothetical protein